MLQDRSYKRTFYNAPQSVTSLVAAFLEPTVIVLVYIGVLHAFGERLVRADLVLCLLVFAITFPGRNRFKDSLLSAAVDTVSTWLGLLAIMLLCGYATSSLGYFNGRVLLWWAVLTPLAQWIPIALGHHWIRRHASLPDNRRTAVVIGAGSLGVKVARSLRQAHEQGIDFVGYSNAVPVKFVQPVFVEKSQSYHLVVLV